MNKHLKCFIKILFSPLVILLVIISLFLFMIVGLPLLISGCLDEDKEPFFVTFVEWYRKL